MNKFHMVVFIILCLSLMIPNTVYAEGTDPVEPVKIADLFTWATQSPPNWGLGALYAGLGLVGSLVTVFGLIGGAVPGTAGFAKIEANMKRLEDREKKLDSLIKDDPKNAADAIKAIEIATNNFRDDITVERRRQFAVAAILYAVLGAFFAALLAQDILQAILVGAGWTAYLGALGLKKDYAERKDVKDEVILKYEDLSRQVRKQLGDFGSTGSMESVSEFDALESAAQVARSI